MLPYCYNWSILSSVIVNLLLYLIYKLNFITGMHVCMYRKKNTLYRGRYCPQHPLGGLGTCPPRIRGDYCILTPSHGHTNTHMFTHILPHMHTHTRTQRQPSSPPGLQALPGGQVAGGQQSSHKMVLPFARLFSSFRKSQPGRIPREVV